MEELYVSYYGRAADPAGLNYWLNQEAAGTADATIALQFVPQLETLGLYPLLNTPTLLAQNVAQQSVFINAVYQNLFGRAADTAGLSYWEGQLTGGASPGFMIDQIILGSLGTDITTIVNRATVAGLYTNAVASAVPAVTWNPTNDTPQSRAIIATITSSSTTVTAAGPLIAADIVLDQSGSNGVGATLTLTAGGQTISPTSTSTSTQTTAHNDTIRGVAGGSVGTSQLTTSDSITGGGGVETLNSVLDNTSSVMPFLAKVQLVNLAPGSANQTFNGLSSSGITALSLAGGIFGAGDGESVNTTLNVINIAATTNVGMMNAAGYLDNLTVTFSGLAPSGNATTLVLSGNTGGTFDTTVSSGFFINTYNIQSSGTKLNTVTIGAQDAGLVSDVITGSAPLVLTNNNFNTGFNTINANATTGGVNITAGALTAKATIIGGSGIDTLNAGLATQSVVLTDGNGANDLLTFNGQVAGNVITVGTGNDTVFTAPSGIGLANITAGDTGNGSLLQLMSDVEVLANYSATNTTIDLTGLAGYTLATTASNAALGATSLLTAVQQVALAAATKTVQFFSFTVNGVSNEYIFQQAGTTGAPFAAGDGLMQVNGAGATFNKNNLLLT